MKTKTLLVQFALWVVLAQAAPAEQNLTNNLRNGLYEEEANHNLPAAIQNYQALISRFDEERKLAATAVFRLAECYRKLGQTNEANAQYQRVTREFFDQTNLAELSRVYLGLNNTPNTGPAGAGGTSLDIVADGQTYHPASEEEAKELRRIITLVKDSPDLVNGLVGSGGDSTLQMAVLGDELAVVQYLLARGANVDGVVQGGQRMTPLALAAGGGHKTMVELLLAHGANPNAQPYGSPPPLHEAAKMGYSSVVEVLLANGAEVNPKNTGNNVALEAAIGYPATIELLLAHGADANVRIGQEETPLMRAADQNQVESARVLLKHHADPNLADGNDLTALYFALNKHYFDLGVLLLANEAKVNAIDSKGRSELDHAAERVDREAVEFSLNHGADATIKDANGATPLHWLWEGVSKQRDQIWVLPRSLKIAELLVRSHVDVNAKNKWGSSVFSRVMRAANVMQFGDTPMEWAKFLVENHADVNSRDSDGYTPLNWLVYPSNASEDTLGWLLDHGADPNVPYRGADRKQRPIPGAFTPKAGSTPLHVARQLGKNDAVAILLAHGAVDRGGDIEAGKGTNAPAGTVNAPSAITTDALGDGDASPILGTSLDIVADGQTYHPASEEEAKELRRVIKLTKDSPDLVNGHSANDWSTPLQNAAKRDHLAVVQYLFLHKVDVDGVVRGGETSTSLALAAMNGHKTMVELLLAHGASVNAHPPSVILHDTARSGYNSIIEVLLAHGADVNGRDADGNTPLHRAVGYKTTMELLLAHGADPNVKNRAQESPLVVAAKEGQGEAVVLLLKHKADPNLADSLGDAALHYALGLGNLDMAGLLLTNGALVNGVDLNGKSELDYAAERIDPKEVGFLLDHGADAKSKDTFGATPLHWLWGAARNRAFSSQGLKGDLLSASFKTAEILLRAQVDINIKDKSGNTVFNRVMRAANESRSRDLAMEWAKFLVDNLADVNMPDNEGKTPLISLIEPGRANEEPIGWLLDHGADPNLPFRGSGRTPFYGIGATPLQIARQFGRTDVAGLLIAHGAVDHVGETKPAKGTNAPSSGVRTNGVGQTANPTQQFFFVGGEVEKPDRYAYVEGLTVTKAIMIAGGSKKGNMASVRLRRAKPGPDQKSEDIIVHVTRALKDSSADYPVYPGDTVWVPEKVF